jgi:hypothetical protein
MDLLKAAVQRQRHGAYIDAMLRRTASDKPASGAERVGAPEEIGGSET